MSGAGGSAPLNSRYMLRHFSIAGNRPFHERSANITIAALSRAAASNESSEVATAYVRPSNDRSGAGRIGVRGCG
jgi:hypothetical protein